MLAQDLCNALRENLTPRGAAQALFAVSTGSRQRVLLHFSRNKFSIIVLMLWMAIPFLKIGLEVAHCLFLSFPALCYLAVLLSTFVAPFSSFSSSSTCPFSDLISPFLALPFSLFLLISSTSTQLFTIFPSFFYPSFLPPTPSSLCLSQDCLVSDRPRPLLLIFDRSCDMFPPLMHTSTYQVHTQTQ
jgi:Sec1 family